MTLTKLFLIKFATFLCLSMEINSDLSVTFLHTNDMHSRIEEIDQYGSKCKAADRTVKKCYGGIARVLSKIQQIKASTPNVVVLDGGDQQTGTLWYDVYQGNATAYFVDKLRFDALVLGNHDFDGGVEHVINYLQKMNSSVVMSNVDASSEPLWPKKKLFEQSLVIEVGGQKLGICGYVLKSTPRYSKPGPNIKFNDEITSVRDCAAKFTKSGINKVVALGHAGIEIDKQIAKEVDDVDVVIGGHTNTFLYSGTPPSNDIPYGPYPLIITKMSGKKCLVVQAFAYTKYLGRLNVNFSASGDIIGWNGNPILLEYTMPKDTGIVNDIARMRTALDKVGKVKIGQTLVYLDGERKACRLGECILGNLITDAVVYHVASTSKLAHAWTTASIALWTSNSIMASIDANKTGYIYSEDIKNSFPYTNKIDIVDLRGNVLLEVLEKSASSYNKDKPNGSFLQTSGIHATFDVTKPINSRVSNVEVRCANCKFPTYEKLNTSKVYRVIISSYMATGGAGYEMLRTKRSGHTPGTVKDTEALTNYIKSKTPIFIEAGSRIHMKSGGMNLNSSSPHNCISLVVTILAFVLPTAFFSMA